MRLMKVKIHAINSKAVGVPPPRGYGHTAVFGSDREGLF